MDAFDLPRVAPPGRTPAKMVRPVPLDCSFEGFGPQAFAVLERLRAHPHVAQYRSEKEAIQAFVTGPFQRYRDDLVVNWVLPNRLNFETEKNVFSRLLKNDFGAGGCHHHLWMSFYRPGRRRLTDFQLIHSLAPDGFTLGLYVGDYAQDLVRQAVTRVAAEPQRFAAILDPLLAPGGWRACVYLGASNEKHELVPGTATGVFTRDPKRVRGIWIRTVFSREEVLGWKGALVAHALDATMRVWPLYQLFAG